MHISESNHSTICFSFYIFLVHHHRLHSCLINKINDYGDDDDDCKVPLEAACLCATGIRDQEDEKKVSCCNDE